MAWTRLQSKYATWATSASGVVLFDNPCTPGSLIVVGVGLAGSGLQASYSIIDDAAQTYALGCANTGGAGNDGAVIRAAINATSAARQITFNNNGVSVTRGDILIIEFSGNIAASPSDGGDAAASGTSTSPLSNSITTSVDNDLLVGLCVTPFTATFAAGSGYTLDVNSPGGATKFGMEYKLTSAAGGNTASMVLGSSQNWQMLIAAFKPVAGTGGGNGAQELQGVGS